jgi:hypothetical protein
LLAGGEDAAPRAYIPREATPAPWRRPIVRTHALQRGIFVLVLLLVGCVAPEPRFASVAGAVPPVPPGAARIFFYRWLEPYETLAPTAAYLNGVPVGVTQPGAVLYRDVAPGQYAIVVESEGIYPNQFKSVLLRSGDVAYVRIESLRSWSLCRRSQGCWDTFSVRIMDPTQAQAEMQNLRLIRG